MEFHERVTMSVPVPPGPLFELLVDVDRLPEWNRQIEAVVETPPVLQPGADWVVRMHVMGARWDSRSTVEDLDRSAMRFVHRTRTDDGNPSFGMWTWQVRPDGDGSAVTVKWDLHPKTFLRRMG